MHSFPEAMIQIFNLDDTITDEAWRASMIVKPRTRVAGPLLHRDTSSFSGPVVIPPEHTEGFSQNSVSFEGSFFLGGSPQKGTQ